MINRLLSKFLEWRQKKKFIKEWRTNNSHNLTTPYNNFDGSKVKVGRYTYGPLQIYYQDVSLSIGDFCSIGPDIHFILGVEHPTDRLFTYPIDCWIFNEKPYNRNKGDTIIEDDV